MNSHHSLWMTFRWPLLIAVLSLTGLVGALLEDGVRDAVFSALLATGLVAVVWVRARAHGR